MEEKKKKAHEKLIAKRMELWKFCIDAGWEVGTAPNTLTNENDVGERVRLAFTDNVLQLQHKVKLTEEEKILRPHRSVRWIILDEARYSNVKIAEHGLIFNPKEKKEKAERAEAKNTTSTKERSE